MTQRGSIRIGVGGWTFPPWRGVFYPDDLAQKNELAYMSRRLTAIEINATYYGSQKPASYRKWASETPDGFVFTLKGSRFATNRRVLAEAGESVQYFFRQGMTELGDKLGPILWQFAPTKKFDAADFEAFLELLPKTVDGRAIRHCVEVRNDSFRAPEFAALLRKHGVPVVFADHEKYPALADVAGDFVYARLQTGTDDCETAYPPAALDAWAGRLKTWAEGGRPDDLACADPEAGPDGTPREVFAFIIHEGKVRAPHGAMALIERLG
ncbi:MAG TPA: DUF72 domain-containing protein [Caulobacteraceae bacterium]|jgi:uncharacterized protein YecE (DUF72 family)|nr:DUF72 domain-containing protein [Caulobacteraceae bacterium]